LCFSSENERFQIPLSLIYAPQLPHTDLVEYMPQFGHRVDRISSPSPEEGEGGISVLVLLSLLPQLSQIMLTEISCSCLQNSHFTTAMCCALNYGSSGNTITSIRKCRASDDLSMGPSNSLTSPRDSMACMKWSFNSMGILANVISGP